MEENWKTIKGFEDYMVSDRGRVISHKRNKIKILTLCQDGAGYLRVALCKTGKVSCKLIHSLVLEAFVHERPYGHEVNHKNGNKGDNFLQNLEWVTPSQNVKHALINGLRIRAHGEKSPASKLKDGEVWLIRKLSSVGITGIYISKMFKISRPQVSRIINYVNWGR